MNRLKEWIQTSFSNGLLALKNFPLVILMSLTVTLVTLVRIHMDWASQEGINHLLNSLQWSLVLAALISLGMRVSHYLKDETKLKTIHLDLISLSLVGIIFVYLNFFGYYENSMAYKVITRLAAGRLSVAVIISILFLAYGSSFKDKTHAFSQGLFMFLKAFATAFIFSSVIALGTTGLAAMVEGLLLDNMSFKVYMYMTTLSYFMGALIFIGHYNWTKSRDESKRLALCKQANFIRLLIDMVLIPISLIMSLILGLWIIRIVVTSDWPEFEFVTGLILSYGYLGTLLIYLSHDHDGNLAKVFKRLFPPMASVVYGFGLYKIILEIGRVSVTTPVYVNMTLMVIGLLMVLVFIIKSKTAYNVNVYILSLGLLVLVLPLLNFQSFPNRMQISRLEAILQEEGILVDGDLVANSDVDTDKQEIITEIIDNLLDQEEIDLPEWLDRDLNKDYYFESALGFRRTYDHIRDSYSRGVFLNLDQVLDISSYDYGVPITSNQGKERIEGKEGVYTLEWDLYSESAYVRVSLNKDQIFNLDIRAYIEKMEKEIIAGNQEVLLVEGEGVFLVFSRIDLYNLDSLDYHYDIYTIFIGEK